MPKAVPAPSSTIVSQIWVMLALRFTMLSKDYGPLVLGVAVSIIFVGASVGISTGVQSGIGKIPDLPSAIPITFNTSAFINLEGDKVKQFTVGSVASSSPPSQALDFVISTLLKSSYLGSQTIPTTHFDSFAAISSSNLNRANATNSASLPFYGAGYKFSDSTIPALRDGSNTALGYIVAIDPSLQGTAFLAMESVVAAASNLLYARASGQNVSMPPILPSYGLFPTKVRNDVGSSIVPPFLTNAATFLLATFTERMVTFREEGFFDLLFISGMSRTSFYVSALIIDLSMYIFVIGVCFIVLYAFSLKFFIETSFAAFAFPALAFGLAMVAQSYYASFFFKKGATVGPRIGILLAMVSFVPYFIVYFVLDDSLPLVAAILVTIFVPQFGIYRAFNDAASSWTRGMAYNLSDTLDLVNRGVPQLTLALLASTVLYSILLYTAAYLNATNQSLGAALRNRRTVPDDTDPELGQNDALLNGKTAGGHAIPDDEVAEETRNIINGTYNPSDFAVLVSNVRKVFKSTAAGRRSLFAKLKAGPKDKVALDGMYLTVRKNEIHGLLGPNGAGKSTLITMLSGLQEVTSGKAYLDSHVAAPVFDPQIRGRSIGLCPQFSTLFPKLSPLDHARTFARLRRTVAVGGGGKDWWNVEEEARKTLTSVGLSEEMWTRVVKGLSGGNKRKVAIALAILGNPAVVFLDEPTTGVDVSIRQEIWETIRALKTTSSVVLTTHSLEEADALSDRISIVIGGRLRVLGTPQRLKHTYARTHTLTLKLSPTSNPQEVISRIRTALPSLEVTNVFGTVVKARMVKGDDNESSAAFYEDIFRKLGTLADGADGVVDAEVGEGSLAEVFVGLVEEQERKEAAAALTGAEGVVV
ncbi:hypothetical protein BJ742DRAFT_465186 [Cladochytrium replicatum]|nr:hypothetical protein BJ742DRAFT_465186 [Cladochytrium replicatum]